MTSLTNNEESRSTAPKPFVFVLMPFADSFFDIYTHGIVKAVQDAGGYAERVDQQIYTEGVHDRICSQIQSAALIVADVTERNPNVMYEVGYAHALDKTVVLLAQDAEDIPFDLRHYPHTIYSQSHDLRDRLSNKVRYFLNNNTKHTDVSSIEIFCAGSSEGRATRLVTRLDNDTLPTVTTSRGGYLYFTLINNSNKILEEGSEIRCLAPIRGQYTFSDETRSIRRSQRIRTFDGFEFAEFILTTRIPKLFPQQSHQFIMKIAADRIAGVDSLTFVEVVGPGGSETYGLRLMI
ncbi:MAG: hypothetical protein AB7Q00_02300 [Phycisphaerales bacterium]